MSIYHNHPAIDKSGLDRSLEPGSSMVSHQTGCGTDGLCRQAIPDCICIWNLLGPRCSSLVACAGRNKLANVTEVTHLRRQKALRSLTVLGNPMCDATGCHAFVIAQLRRLQFLDNQRLTAADVTKAIELHQVNLPSVSDNRMQMLKQLVLSTQQRRVLPTAAAL